MSYYKNKHEAFEFILKEMIELLPSSYNKEVDDTNYYKLLRALSVELADAQIEIKQIQDNAYLDTVSPDAMYKNFGKLIELQKDPTWSDEKYRHLIKGVTQSLLKGPTKQSLIDGFKLFTNFKVNIYELYKDLDKLDPAIYEGYNPMFTFALEIEKPVDEYVDQASLMRDANYIINIIKPAHTLTINIITIVGEENYKKYYRIDKVLGKEIEDLFSLKILAKINEKIMQRFFDESRDYAQENDVSFDEAVDILRQLSNGMNQSTYDQLIRDISEKLLQNYNQSSSYCTPIRLRSKEYFIEIAREQSRGTLEKKYYEELKDEVFNNVNVSLSKEEIYKRIIEKQNELIKIWEDAGNNRFDKSDEQWYNEALNALKEEYLRNFIIQELGGKEKLWKECSDLVEPYRLILEQNMEKTAPYCGMDQMEIEASLTNTEGVFGWRHTDYDLQLKTSLDGNESRIGGIRLIGPRYVLNETINSDVYLQNEDELPDKFLNRQRKYFNLNHSKLATTDMLSRNTDDSLFQKFGEENHIYLHQSDHEIAPIPCDHNTHIQVETFETINTPLEEDHTHLHQSMHEFAHFLKGGPGFILNEGILNDHATYFAYEPDHVEEIHVDVFEKYENPKEESITEITLAEQIENWELPEEHHLAELDLNLFEKLPLPSEEKTVNIEFLLDEKFNSIIESNLIDITFGEKSENWILPEENHLSFFDWDLNEKNILPIEESTVNFEFNQNENFHNVVEEKHLEIEQNLTEYAKFARGYFELNDSLISGDDLLSYNSDPITDIEVDGLNETYSSAIDSCVLKMYKIVDNQEVIIAIEAI